MNVGPTAEKEPTQKIIMVFVLLGFIALLVVPALANRRFMWSCSPAVGLGDRRHLGRPWIFVSVLRHSRE